MSDEVAAPKPRRKNWRLAKAGRKGGKIGGRVTADRLTPAQRSAKARAAALARWGRGDVGNSVPLASIVR